MAFKAFMIVMIFAIAIAPAFAYEYMVGDDSGWMLQYNYTEWAKGKDFRVGDKLMFMYNKDAHNVAKVNASDFQQCVASNTSNLLTSGNDVITLATPGKKWYICTKAGHCTQGMKLVITVLEDAPAPASPPTSAASQVSRLASCVLVLAALAAFKMIIT